MRKYEYFSSFFKTITLICWQMVFKSPQIEKFRMNIKNQSNQKAFPRVYFYLNAQ